MEVPRLQDFESARVNWIERFELFDITPVFKKHIADFSQTARDFVYNILQLNLQKCIGPAKLYFQNKDTEEAAKCMELLALVAGWPNFHGGSELIKQITKMYDKERITIGSITHKQFVGDALYTGFCMTFRSEDGIQNQEFDEDNAEFFRWTSCEMYRKIPDGTRLIESRKGLGEPLALYSASPEYYPYDVWGNWYSEPGSETDAAMSIWN
jgi:hypothetical protein